MIMIDSDIYWSIILTLEVVHLLLRHQDTYEHYVNEV